jgi:hypothetical protein
MLNHQGYLPDWALVTDGKIHDVKVAQKLEFTLGTVVAMDRRYVDYEMFNRWTSKGVWFVTRAKVNMNYRVDRTITCPFNNTADLNQRAVNSMQTTYTVSINFKI